MSTENTLYFDGIDGSNPLAFLAALGTIRTVEGALGEVGARLAWSRRKGAWRPSLTLRKPFTQGSFVTLLHEQLGEREGMPQFDLGRGENNLSVKPAVFREFVVEAVQRADHSDRETADFAAAFGCEAAVDRRRMAERILDTAFRTMSGSGWQHFLGNMRNIIAATEPEHMQKALFAEWRYSDPLKSLSMRWDPTEDRRHAYQWTDPTDASERRTGSMLGANRLAIEALPFFPTVPVNHSRGITDLLTVGFRRARKGAVEWTWPIWEPALTSRVIATLLSLNELQESSPRSVELRPRGIVAAFRSTRISVDYFRNFTPAVAV